MKKKRNIVIILERIAIMLIVGGSAYALFFSLTGNADDAAGWAIDAVAGSVIIMMLYCMIRNIRIYSNTGSFFGTYKPTASLGLTGYLMSRAAWTSFFTTIILVNHSYSGTTGDAAATAALASSFLLAVPSVIIGINFFIRRSNEIKGRQAPSPTFREYYGSGEGTHLRLRCADFDRIDDHTGLRLEIVTGGAVNNTAVITTSPSRFLLDEHYGIDAYPVTANSLEELASVTAANYLRAFNDLLRKLGYGTVISPDDWRAVIMSSADQWVLNRLTSAVDVRYYLLSCTDMLLYPRGLTVVELQGFGQDISLAVIVRADRARALDFCTR